MIILFLANLLLFGILHIRKGVKQEEQLDMVAYGIWVPLLIKQLNETHPDITQPCYNDDTGALGTYNNIELYFYLLKHSGPGHGYYPKPSKSVLIVHPDNFEMVKQFVLHHKFKVCTGTCDIGYFIRNNKYTPDWMHDHTATW